LKTLNVTAGCDYKVTNKKTKITQIFNAQELANFIFKNDFKNYRIENLSKNLIDRLPLWFLYLSSILITVASIMLHIKLNY